MKKETYDKDILLLLRSHEEDKAIQELYKYFPMVLKFIKNNGGNRSDAEDVFQDSLMVLYKNSTRSDFELTCTAHTYIFKIAKYMWKDILAKRNRHVNYQPEFEDDYDEQEIKSLHHEKEDEFNLMQKVIQSLGQKCIQILELYYYKGLRIKKIAEIMGYKSENSLKTQKYKCMEKAKLKLKEYQLNEA